MDECKPLRHGARHELRRAGIGGRDLHPFTLELNLSNSMTHSRVTLV